MFATLQAARNTPHLWLIAAGLGIGLLAVTWLAVYLLRKFFQSTRETHKEEIGAGAPRTENPSAFMTASMQGVIQQLREQEKELERLHRLERERAEQTERLSEEVTRNMPAGLLVVNATGLISSSNPAAEEVLGIRGLGFRRYSEALGASTELAALQQRMQLKENLAALGELSAGIAHEFKNALAIISGYAQMIQSEPSEKEAADYAERILKQTRNITHVVTEFLKYARPLEIPDETVALEKMVERVITEVGEAIPYVKIRCEGTFGEVCGDEGLLRQALLNVGRNAAEACASAVDGGRVVIQGEIVRGNKTDFQRIAISDNGPGISAEAL